MANNKKKGENDKKYDEVTKRIFIAFVASTIIETHFPFSTIPILINAEDYYQNICSCAEAISAEAKSRDIEGVLSEEEIKRVIEIYLERQDE